MRSVATNLAGTLRKIDLVARYGGDEFAILAPDCTFEGASVLAERLRAGVERASVEWEGRVLRVTLTVGVGLALWPDYGKSSEHLVRAADEALYAAKRAGRNCWRAEPIERAEASHPDSTSHPPTEPAHPAGVA